MYDPDEVEKEKETSETKRTDEGTTDNHTEHPSLRRPSTKINLSSSVARANTLNFSLTALNFFSSLN